MAEQKKPETLELIDEATVIISTPADSISAWNEFLLVEKIHEQAYVPNRATDGSIGYDLRAFSTITIEPKSKINHGLNIRITPPKNCYGRIAPKSGLADKFSIDVFAGVIDRDYQGEVCVILYNHSDYRVEFKAGDKIAQLILERAAIVPVKVVSSIKDITSKSFRKGGFGSTGV